ncbi:MAG: cystathionine beta-lyase [Burkholderiales bacterium]|nr:cystathionine beta-lyase [Burkholderiales bacterium]
MRKDTILSHAGRAPERFDGAVNVPVIRASTILFPDVESHESGDRFTSVRYGRHGTSTRFALEETLAQLEGAARVCAVGSGVAAIVASLLAFTRSGDHILVADNVYGPTRNFCQGRLKLNGVETEFYDPHIGAGIERLLRANTRLVYCESPGSLTFEMQDIPAIAAAAHARGIPVLADNTWATPYFFRPFEKGIDISIHSATKYIVGHADVILGTIGASAEHWRTIRQTVADYGYTASPDDCYLALRGLRTLAPRLKQHMQSALTVARWLQGRPEVARVLYPALETDPGYALWKRDLSGAASLFGVELRPVADAAVRALLNSLRYFGHGASWGGFESLITYPKPERLRSATAWSSGPLLRLHIGLEDPADLMADLAAGFKVLHDHT